LDGLGPDLIDYEGGEKALWAAAAELRKDFTYFNQPLPSVAVYRDLQWVVFPLIRIYRDPVAFFRDIAPAQLPEQFGSKPENLAQAVWMWGPGALLNEDLYQAVRSLPPDQLSDLLAQADGRDCYREGRKMGSRDSMEHRRRLKAAELKASIYARADQIEDETAEPWGAVKRAIEESAALSGVKPATVKRGMSPRRPKK
jgi:hypothetical protein